MSPQQRPFRRPAFLPPIAMDNFAVAESDPAVITRIAHETAAALVAHARGTVDEKITHTVVNLVETVGLDTIADLWSRQSARTLPGALWRLCTIRAWVKADPGGISTDYHAGLPYADVASVVAGVAHPPGPAEITQLTEDILRGVFTGDVAVAFHRAAAFCVVLAAGKASREPAGELSAAHAHAAAKLHSTAADLEACARLWERGNLD